MAGVEGYVFGAELYGLAIASAAGLLLLPLLAGAILLAEHLSKRKPMAGDSYGWEWPLPEAEEPMPAEAAKIRRAA